MNDLNKKAWVGLLRLFLGMAALIFLPARTLHYPQAWVLLAVFFGSMLPITIYLMKNDPQLLERRMNTGARAEKENSQKVLRFLITLSFISIFVVSVLDHRFAWSTPPPYAIAAGDVLVALGLLSEFFVLRANTFASSTIEIHEAQKVISTGPYAFVRHPMYSGMLVMLVGVPLALGSEWGLCTILPMALILVWRLLDEEKLLDKNLPGYSEYRNEVRSRLLPFIW